MLWRGRIATTSGRSCYPALHCGRCRRFMELARHGPRHCSLAGPPGGRCPEGFRVSHEEFAGVEDSALGQSAIPSISRSALLRWIQSGKGDSLLTIKLPMRIALIVGFAVVAVLS